MRISYHLGCGICMGTACGCKFSGGEWASPSGSAFPWRSVALRGSRSRGQGLPSNCPLWSLPPVPEIHQNSVPSLPNVLSAVLSFQDYFCHWLPYILTHYFPSLKQQPKCSLTDEWIKNIRHTHTMDHYSAIRKN